MASNSIAKTSGDPLVFDPAVLVAEDSRLFLDTNVFMETSQDLRGGLEKLFARVTPVIEDGGSPVIVPTKVLTELAKFRTQNLRNADPDRAAATNKAANALAFLESASEHGLVRKDLGDDTNPYADDLFVDLFSAYAGRYSMTLVTNDITLLLRINLLGVERGAWLIAGRLNRDGLVECELPQSLYERGHRKLRRIQRRLESAEADRKDELEADALHTVLREFASATGVVEPERPTRAANATRHGRSRVQSNVADLFPPDTPFRGADRKLPVSEIPGEGDGVFIETATGKEKIILAERLGTGGEGSVFSVSPTQVIKIFDEDHITAHRNAKIELLASRNLAVPGICFPQAVVRNLHGEFVGYSMPRANGKEFSRALFNPRRFRRDYPTWTKTDLIEVAISFLEKVSYLHSLNIILGDINPKNLLVDDDKSVWIIDADSWQLDGFPSPVGTDMFSAPEIIGKHYPDFLRTIENERFAVATMLFMILITGQFPYARSGSDGDITELILEGNFAFQYKGNSNQDQPAGNWKYMWSHIQSDLKGMFWHTFHRDGDRYASRPTDAEWLDAFHRFRRYLARASFDPMSNDVYPTRFKAMARDTPIYECNECGASMAGIWNDKTKKYSQPRICNVCRSKLPKCAQCGRPSSSLREGFCWNCNRKRNFACCAECGRVKPKRSLVEGKCFDCNQGRCSGCDRQIPKRYLDRGLCDGCAPKSCVDCGRSYKKSSMTRGRCSDCHRALTERQRQARARAAEKARIDAELDTTRLCTRCGKPFISNGNVAWHRRNGRAIPTTHKVGYGSTYPPECVPLPEPAKEPQGANGNPGGCYVATAVYGSYDVPQVWVLRRWRDDRLSRTSLGRAFIRTYYRWSPRLVAACGTSRAFVVPARLLLDRLVRRLRKAGVLDTPYIDL